MSEGAERQGAEPALDDADLERLATRLGLERDEARAEAAALRMRRKWIAELERQKNDRATALVNIALATMRRTTREIDGLMPTLLRREAELEGAVQAEKERTQAQSAAPDPDPDALNGPDCAWVRVAAAQEAVCEAARAWDALTRGAAAVGPFRVAAALKEIRVALGALAEAEREAREGLP